MNCFQHTNKPAVGACTYCGRGLCVECVTAVQGKLSCRGACEIEVARQRQHFEKSERAVNQRSIVYETSGKMYHQAFAAMAFFGLTLFVLGVVLLFTDWWIMGAVFCGFGAIFALRGIGLARAGKKFKALAAEDRSEATTS